MFGLSLPTLPFLGNGSDAKDDAPVVLTYEQVEEIGRELDALRDRTVASLGAEDREYIYKIIKAQRGFEVAGRGLMYLGFLPPVWLAAVGALSVSKILDNMEIGHNVMHGQYDWMREPGLNSEVFEWDTVCPADQWRHSHNYMHHTYTNILGKDRDIGYGILRIDDAQKWNPYYLGNPVWAFALMVLFEWGVMMHDLEIENVIQGKRKWHDVKPLLKGWWNKAGKQVLKDYVIFPVLTGPLFVTTLAGNVTANLVRNVWTYSIIFCGHFPTGVQSFTEDETADETRGQWYVRQMLGSANIEEPALPHHVGQPLAPDRAPPVPGPACASLSGTGSPGERIVCEVRFAVQHRWVLQADRFGVGQDLQARSSARFGQVEDPSRCYRRAPANSSLRGTH
ncbi:hypothetical protein GCM10020255_092340 [Rhodococcus baikonurensis]